MYYLILQTSPQVSDKLYALSICKITMYYLLNIYCYLHTPMSFQDSLSKKAAIAFVATQPGLKQFCEQVPLAPYIFYPDKPVHIQVSVNHVNFSDPSYVHEAVVTWVERIADNSFTVCVTQAGRNEKRNGETFATVDWLAFRGPLTGECRVK